MKVLELNLDKSKLNVERLVWGDFVGSGRRSILKKKYIPKRAERIYELK